jgi:predicted thioesterase
MVVTKDVTAKSLESGSLEVLATPALAALMEKAACLAVDPYLSPGITTVGVLLTLKHEAASGLGAKVTATAKIVSAQGREIRFEIKASDEAGQVGSCDHARFAVGAERFMEKVGRRAEGPKS